MTEFYSLRYFNNISEVVNILAGQMMIKLIEIVFGINKNSARYYFFVYHRNLFKKH